MEAPPPRCAPFSTHSRGVPLFNRGRFFDVPRHVARLLLDLRDISSSAFFFLACQTWLTFWAALNTMCAGECAASCQEGRLAKGKGKRGAATARPALRCGACARLMPCATPGLPPPMLSRLH